MFGRARFSFVILFFCGGPLAAQAQIPDPTIVSNNQIAVMLLVDYARSYGYQSMMAKIQLDRDRAQFERDAQFLKQKEELHRRKSVPLIELEIAQLKNG